MLPSLVCPECLQILAALHKEGDFMGTLMPDRLLLTPDDKLYHPGLYR